MIQTSAINRDIDSAAKFIGAGAATVGVAGAGNYCLFFLNWVSVKGCVQRFGAWRSGGIRSTNVQFSTNVQ